VFQAEDGIRDATVTGVQTCALPIYDRLPGVVERLLKSGIAEISESAVVVFFRDIPELADKPCIIRKRDGGFNYATSDIATVDYRSEERRVGKECKCRRSQE